MISAEPHGTVNPAGLETECWFEYGTTEAYGTKTPTQTLAVGSENKAISALITGLVVGVEYHYRVVAKNAEGESKALIGTDGPRAAAPSR